MLEIYFKDEVKRLCNNGEVNDKLWTEIAVNYGKSSRYYHNLLHLESLLRELLPIRNEIMDWGTLIFSIAYHDVVYNVMKKDNEEKSAEFAYERLSKLGLPEEIKNKCSDQILATKSHQHSADGDTNFFTDADLSVLGADPDSYSIYTSQIRKEYRIYPDLIYKPGRKKVLLHFLAMKHIFKTDYFRNRCEGKARNNLAAELMSL